MYTKSLCLQINLALIAKSSLDQTKIADYDETYLIWIWRVRLSIYTSECVRACGRANANEVSVVCILNLHVSIC